MSCLLLILLKFEVGKSSQTYVKLVKGKTLFSGCEASDTMLVAPSSGVCHHYGDTTGFVINIFYSGAMGQATSCRTDKRILRLNFGTFWWEELSRAMCFFPNRLLVGLQA